MAADGQSPSAKRKLQRCTLHFFANPANDKNEDRLISETQIWMLRTYSAMGRSYDAENIANILLTKPLTKVQNQLFNETYAYYFLCRKNYESAIPYSPSDKIAKKLFTKNSFAVFAGATLCRNRTRKRSLSYIWRSQGIEDSTHLCHAGNDFSDTRGKWKKSSEGDWRIGENGE